MMSTAFPQSFEESNPAKKQVIEKWLLANVDYSQQKKHQVICFKNATSSFFTSLPEIRKWQPVFKARVMEAIVDRDMKEDLVRSGLINWCCNVRYLVPITVPRDGNCLLHSVAVAVWGITDSRLMMRRLLCLALGIDQDHRFRSRWLHQRQRQIGMIVDKLLESGVEVMDKEWLDIRQCLEPEGTPPVAAPHRFLESIHVYALANVLRRPILVLTDPATRSFSGLSLQDNDMGGIYLPLEWSWADTCPCPVLLGYAHSHFCPLLFAEHPKQRAGPERTLAALVNSAFEQLPVRFLLPGEEREAGTLLRKYLRVRETVVQVGGRGGGLQNVLCAEVEGESLPAELNVAADYVRDCERRFRQETMTSSSSGQRLPAAASSPAAQAVREKGHLQGLPPHPVRREQLQGAWSPEYALGDPTLYSAGLGQSQIHIPPPSLLSSGERSASLNPPPDRKCVVPACKYFGDPSLAMMCSICFRNYTIRESRHLAASGGKPLPSVSAGQEPYLPISLMKQQCQEQCGFFCSVHTFPYCHECAGMRQRQAQEKMLAASLGQVGTAGEEDKSPALPCGSGQGSQALEEIREAFGNMTTKTASAAAQGASSASPLTAGGALTSAVAETDPPQPLGQTSPLPTRRVTEEALTRAMVTGEQACAEPGATEEPSCQQLFGSGQASAPPSPQPAQADPAPAGEAPGTTPTGPTPSASGGAQVQTQPQQDPDLVTPASADAQVPSEREAGGDEGQSTQQRPAPEEGDRQQEQLGDPGQGITSAACLARSHRRTPPVLQGAGESDAKEVCTNPNCSQPAAHKTLCGNCYVGQDLSAGEGAAATEDRTKMTSMHSTSSSAPPSIGPAAATTANIPTSNPALLTAAESRSQPSSFRDLTQIPSMNYTQSWIQDNRFVGSPSFRKVQAQPEGPPEGPPEGLPEKPESETLGNDLIASGAECFSSTQRCIGSGCGNVVPQAGRLCQQCQDILQQARQASGAAASAQAESERLAQAKCRTERCSFFGIPQNLGYCTGCYGKHVEREVRSKHHHARTVQSPPSSAAPRLSPTITVPPEFNYVHTPSGQQGQQCLAVGCRLFGDPKQDGMCFTHYWQHISSINKAMDSMPAASRQPEVTGIGYAPGVRISSSSVTVFRSGDTFPPPQVSVPPPPPPQASGMSSRSHEPSLGETFYRVARHSMGKCLNPVCTNFGNRSKGGLCNSCAEGQRADDDLISRAIYGDEAIG